MGMQNPGNGKGLGDSPPPEGGSPPRTCPGDNRGFMGSEAVPCPGNCWSLGCAVPMVPRGCWGHPVPTQPWADPAQQSWGGGWCWALRSFWGPGPLGVQAVPPATCPRG